MKDKTLKEIRQKMADYRQPAPEISWDEMENALAKNRKADVVPMWTKRLAMAAVMLLLVGMGWHMLKHVNDVEESPLAQVETSKQPQKSTSAFEQDKNTGITTTTTDQELSESSESESITTDTENGLSSVNGACSAERKISMQKGVTNAIGKTPTKIDDDSSMAPTSIVNESADEEEKTDELRSKDVHNEDIKLAEGTQNKEQRNVIEEKKSTAINPQQSLIHQTGIIQEPVIKRHRLIAQAYFSNMIVGGNGSSPVTPTMMAASPYGPYMDYTDVGESFPLNIKQLAIEEVVHHHQPLRFGLSLRYQLDTRWSIDGGLSYAYLSSDITRKEGGYTYETEQRLSYVGIPVNINYIIWGSNRFRIYASIGGMVEKMVKGSRSTYTVVKGQESPSTSEKVSIRPLQLSISCAAGVDFLLGGKISLFAQPGVTYHFDNNSSIPTFYQDKPFSFDFNLGLRFNINK